MKNNLVFAAILTAGLIFVSLGTNHVYAQTTKGNMAMKDSVKYTCSHHPEVVSDEPGKCPKCGMDLVVMSTKSTGMKKDKMMHHDGKMKKEGMKHDKMKKDSTMMKKEKM